VSVSPRDEAALLALVREQLERGDLEGGIETLEQAGLLLKEKGRSAAAASLLIAAARLRVTQGEMEQAESLLSLAEAPAVAAGKLADWWRGRAELAESRSDVEAHRDAWMQVVRAGGNERTRPLALLRLADMALVEGDPARAARLQGDAIAMVAAGAGADARARTELAHLHIERAISLAAAGDDATARAELDRAEALVLPGEGGLRARLLGQRSVMAARRGDAGAALHLAESARDAAVAATDVLAYLPSVLLLCGLHLDAGREVEAYDALVRARASLKDLLGPPGAELVKPAIDAFSARLGDRFDTVRDLWIAARRRAQEHR
jgi:hypothetical protein